MAEITDEFIKHCYELGKLVHQDKMDMLDATEKMSEVGMTDSSAFMYLTAVQCMLSGKVFQRTISYKAAEYFLKKISEEFDENILENALKSLEQYVAYINKDGGKRKSQEQALIKRYRNETVEEDSAVLKNLSELGSSAAEKYKSEYVWREIELSDSLKKKIKEHLELHNNSCVMADYTGRVVTSSNNTTDFSYQMLEVASYFVEFYNEGKKYDDFAKEVLDYTRQRVSTEFTKDRKFGTKLFSCLRDAETDWKTKVSEQFSQDVADILEEAISNILPDDGSKDLFITCITNKGWSHSSKTIERANYDYISSAVKSLAKVVAVNHGFMSPILEMFSNDEDIFHSFNKEIKAIERPSSASETGLMTPPGYNLIVYGAPGSGKSYFINTKSVKDRTIRTVFHPEYQHSDFAGCLKPSRDENGDITYSFVPGPFIKILLRAAADPQNDYTLIIEEINRANAPAVFGDIFQLLDRKPNGQSEYSITPDEALQKFLEGNSYKTPDCLSIPPNLKILATMNSADQGVFMMDSAFKRRWKFKYRPILFEDGEATFDDPCIPYKGEKYCWRDFATVINDHLKEMSIEEDRLIGPYFLSDKEREDENASKDAVSGKLLIYLWDDVLRHGLREKIFLKKFKTFAELITAYKKDTKDQGVFVQDLELALQKKLEARKISDRSVVEEQDEVEAEEAA